MLKNLGPCPEFPQRLAESANLIWPSRDSGDCRTISLSVGDPRPGLVCLQDEWFALSQMWFVKSYPSHDFILPETIQVAWWISSETYPETETMIVNKTLDLRHLIPRLQAHLRLRLALGFVRVSAAMMSLHLHYQVRR